MFYPGPAHRACPELQVGKSNCRRWGFLIVAIHKVYLVFVNDEGVAYNWRWEKADADDPKLPNGYQTRFKKRAL